MIELVGKYTIAKIFAETIEEGVYQQVYDIINCRAFEGQKVVCMPDVHVGASGPCGLVATIGSYVCPEHIGVDIGCSVSMMILDKKVPVEKYAEFERRIKNKIPFGFNLNGKTIIDYKDFYKFLTTGFNKYRNFWSEMLMDLPNQVTLHFGSRNFGVKVCKYWMGKTNVALTKDEVKEYTQEFKKDYLNTHENMKNFKNDLNIYLETKKEGHIKGYLNGEPLKGYLCDMCFCQLYAQYNHMTVRKTIKELLQKYGIKEVRTITSTHNFIDLHDHTLRKSAIRAYEGEEMLVPFNMRDGVAICEGLSNSEWLNACAHGAGRKMSRSKAKANVSMDEFKESMKDVYSTTVCKGTIDESPMAYKDTNEIKDLIQETCKIKFMMIPKINIKAADGGD